MEFGIWSNGFRRHTHPATTFEEDLQEIILADRLGFRDAYISEHHSEPVYVGKIDTLPVPELLMCKAAALTEKIRFGAAIKIAHLQHPVDTAIQAATADNVIGDGRFIFGFGSGFPSPLFSEERGLSYDERHERLLESLDLIQKIWAAKEPFDWKGKYWEGKSIVPEPHPFNGSTIPMATATEQPGMIRMAGEQGWTLLSSFLEPSNRLQAKIETYCAGAAAAGRKDPRANVAVSRLVYIADSKQQAVEDLREEISLELDFQMKRGLFAFAKNVLKLPLTSDTLTIEDMVDMKLYTVGSVAEVREELTQAWRDCGGFGTLLLITGKGWASREKRERSLRLFMEEVAPALRELPAEASETVAAP